VRRDDLEAALNQAPSEVFSFEPSVLMFMPDGGDEGNRTLRLVGWAYAVNLSTAPLPNFPDIPGFCIPNHEWFFHEAGVHTADGGFSPGIPPNPVGVLLQLVRSRLSLRNDKAKDSSSLAGQRVRLCVEIGEPAGDCERRRNDQRAW
jgi:hypothetical protein